MMPPWDSTDDREVANTTLVSTHLRRTCASPRANFSGFTLLERTSPSLILHHTHQSPSKASGAVSRQSHIPPPPDGVKSPVDTESEKYRETSVRSSFMYIRGQHYVTSLVHCCTPHTKKKHNSSPVSCWGGSTLELLPDARQKQPTSAGLRKNDTVYSMFSIFDLTCARSRPRSQGSIAIASLTFLPPPLPFSFLHVGRRGWRQPRRGQPSAL